MKSVFYICLLSLLKVCIGDIGVCLLDSEYNNRENNADVCESEGTTSLQDKSRTSYHVIVKRSLNEQNVSTKAAVPEVITEPEVTTEPDLTTVPDVTTVQTSNASEQHNYTILQTPPTTEANNQYDPDSGQDSVVFEDLDTTNTLVDHHRYYKSFLKHGDETEPYWVDFETLEKGVVIINGMLSSSYRRALSVHLTFNFPFYGHVLDNITIATGGFLFTGGFLHKWLAATQYIAPLMANFDTSKSKNAMVKYVDNGTSLTVQWENVLLQDNQDAGPFTFQVTIKKSGHIVFAYKDVPMTISLIGDNKHPVKVGLSDAYIVEKTIFYLRKKTIYEYHKIDMIDMKKGYYISNRTAIVFEPLPNCVQFHSCKSCLSQVTAFKCTWCQQVGRCSDGLDRHRQDWINGHCMEFKSTNLIQCASLPPYVPTARPRYAQNNAQLILPIVEENNSNGHGGLVIALIIMALLTSLAAWISYAYFNPHSSSGQMLIKYRPSTWSWRGSGVKYTAATMHSIHM